MKIHILKLKIKAPSKAKNLKPYPITQHTRKSKHTAQITSQIIKSKKSKTLSNQSTYEKQNQKNKNQTNAQLRPHLT